MAPTTAVFLIDDDTDLRKAVSQTLDLAGFTVSAFARAADALDSLPADFPGVVVSDIRMPDIDGLKLYELIRARDPDLPVILITGHGDIPMAVRAIQNGVYDFIAKPFPAEYLVQSLQRAAEKRALVLENRALRRSVEAAGDLPLIGQTPAMERLRHTLRQIADTDVDVLIRGETGSGKEVVATLLHRWSRRRRGHFVALNCGALPDTVIESELFGHEAGAFTGAQKRRIGRIEHASGGTLFLDEIESMAVATQIKMLRVLEMRQITPLGTNEVRPVDLRVVVAAKVDLSDPGVRGDFREDLYYRLNVVTLSIPPLRERREDIPLLFRYFVERAAERFSKPAPDMPSALTIALKERPWPGNVRELAHVAERFVLGLDSSDQQDAAEEGRGDNLTLPERIDRFEAKIIRETLAQHQGDIKATLEVLGIARKTFYDKLTRHRISRGDYMGKASGRPY